MILIGLLWITSWISSITSAQRVARVNSLSNTQSKLLVSSVNLEGTHQPFFALKHSQSKIFSVALVPSSFLRTNWDSQDSKPKQQEQSKPSLSTAFKDNPRFCQARIAVKKPQPKSVLASFLPAISLIEPNSLHRYFFPNKILRPLQNFFNFSQKMKENLNSPTTVVRVVQRDKDNYEIWLRNRLVASLPSEEKANIMQRRLAKLLDASSFDASQLKPALVDGIPALMAGNRFIFGIDKQISQEFNRSGDLIAIEWTNNLRAALRTRILSLAEGQLSMYGLQPSNHKMAGLASWYGDYFHGRTTANGEVFNENDLTVAHKTLPFNTFLKVTNLKNGNSVVVRVNDRGPYIPPRTLDLSKVAARCVAGEETGVIPYTAVILKKMASKE
ncbi:MAG: septal ring lytic transglycosylase RlpA family protein [Calothrix sp. SM1_7_51]|nr:septal ring lytic transglycosylase RlpA family protein [Calothrix sp. SM1_7_51]